MQKEGKREVVRIARLKLKGQNYTIRKHRRPKLQFKLKWKYIAVQTPDFYLKLFKEYFI
jgi:hypothetical protein